MKKVLCLLLVFCLLFCFTSCEFPFNSLFTVRISADELSEGYERKTTEEGKITDAFLAAMADFSLSLFRGTLTKDKDNDLCSPLSAVLCLAMIANGADGETKKQMEDALGMDVDSLNLALYAYTSSLYCADDCQVSIADSIWFRDEENRLSLREEFLQTNADFYDAQIYAAPFDEQTVKDINNWCKQHTDGMIDKMIDKIDADTVMYLINALAFDAKWETEYEKSDIRDGTFHNYDGTTADVDMLHSKEYAYYQADGVCGFSKYYKGGAYSFVGLLPDEGVDIYEYIAALDGEGWTDIIESKKRVPVYVAMPEFTYSAKMDLIDTLEAMGMVNMFTPDADFSKMGKSFGGNLYVSEVCQKTYIEVNRNGTKAAAITWGAMKETACPPEEEYYVTLDRPFIYAILDNETGLPLFIGAVSGL